MINMPNNGGAIRRLTMRQKYSQALSVSPFSFHTQVHDHGGAAWEASFSLRPMDSVEGQSWAAFFSSLEGMKNTFILEHPDISSPQEDSSAGGAPEADTGAVLGLSNLPTKGWTPDQPRVLSAGDFVSVDNRMYILKSNAVTDGSGGSTLDVFPPLREVPAPGQPIELQVITGTFRLSVPSIEWETDSLNHYRFPTIVAVEAL